MIKLNKNIKIIAQGWIDDTGWICIHTNPVTKVENLLYIEKCRNEYRYSFNGIKIWDLDKIELLINGGKISFMYNKMNFTKLIKMIPFKNLEKETIDNKELNNAINSYYNVRVKEN